MVELTNVPPELRMATGSPSSKPSESRLMQAAGQKPVSIYVCVPEPTKERHQCPRKEQSEYGSKACL